MKHKVLDVWLWPLVIFDWALAWFYLDKYSDGTVASDEDRLAFLFSSLGAFIVSLAIIAGILAVAL